VGAHFEISLHYLFCKFTQHCFTLLHLLGWSTRNLEFLGKPGIISPGAYTLEISTNLVSVCLDDVRVIPVGGSQLTPSKIVAVAAIEAIFSMESLVIPYRPTTSANSPRRASEKDDRAAKAAIFLLPLLPQV
jgi:hypothetical protein